MEKIGSDRVMQFLQDPGKRVMLYHTDVDGICAAALVLRFFPGYELIPREGPLMDDKFLRGLVEKRPDSLLVLDIPIDQESKRIKRLQSESPNTRILVIDHHLPEHNLTSEKNIHLNPRFVRNVYVPASVLVFKLLERLGMDVKPLVWIAALGVIGDYAFENCRDILQESVREFPEIGPDAKKSVLGDISESIMSSVVLHGTRGVSRSLEIMLHAERYTDLAKNTYLLDCERKVKKEIGKILADFGKHAKQHHDLDLIMYKLKSRLSIASTISTILAERNPDKIIVITKPNKQQVKISARYQAGKINLSDLMKVSVAGIGSGGGHEKAAGAIVGRKHMPEFERRLLSRIRELRGKR